MKVDQAKIRALLIEAVGRASMCWEPKPDGVFDSTEAIITADHYANLILAELAKDKPTAPAGLVEELREEMKRNSNATTGAIQCWMVEEILSRHRPVKEEVLPPVDPDYLKWKLKQLEEVPLAVLADRKGVYIRAIRHYPDAGQWAIYIQELSIWMTSANYGVEYTGDTYPAAEQAAREYLEKMEDVK